MALADQEIWQWTLTKDSVAPCFVRDVHVMRETPAPQPDFFWLGCTPCRSVLLLGMVVAVQAYDKRTIYTIDDGTAVIDCILRNTSRPPSPPITDPGYPVRIVGKVVPHHGSRQIHADTIDPCPSSLDEIDHLQRVIHLHKTKYSLPVPFILPTRSTSLPSVSSTTPAPAASIAPYTLPPPRIPLRGRPSPIPTRHNASRGDTRVPPSPTTSSITSSTPSSPCKTSSPVKDNGIGQPPPNPKLRHPSRLHTRDLTANTLRLYVKHYMDNAPPPFPFSSFSERACRDVGQTLETPTKRTRWGEDDCDERTPRPCTETRDRGVPTLGFTLSHLRRVPELALLAARVVRAEARKRDRADKETALTRVGEGGASQPKSLTSASSRGGSESGGQNGRANSPTSASAPADPARKKIKRLFSWAVVKLYEEGSIVLWVGDVRPLPIPPPPVVAGDSGMTSGLWKSGYGTRSTHEDPSVSQSRASSPDPCSSTSFLYTSSASASLYSHYRSPRRDSRMDRDEGDADPAYLSDPPLDEEAYVPLTPRFLAGYVREAVAALRGRGDRRGASAKCGAGKSGFDPTPEDILAYFRRTDGRWARLGVWAVEEALEVLKKG